MIKNTKCECGHQNPVGTELCESCGNPLADDGGTAPLEMRYDGVARRSQKQNPNILDRVWNFFSSVKIAVYLIIITLIGATLGTIYPQENIFYNTTKSAIKKYYADSYGLAGEIYYMLGLSRTYESWWFLTLLIMIGASLVICSLDRVLPLYRALSKQQIAKHPRFLLRQKVAFDGPLATGDKRLDANEWLASFAGQLRAKHYRVHTDGQALLAEKNRFSRWGPYVNHVGLIIFLLAVLMRTIIPSWGMDINIELQEGEMKPIEGTPYYLKSEKFVVEYYQEDELPPHAREDGKIIPKKFETQAVLFEEIDGNLKEVARHNILVNSPLKYKHMAFYQFHFEPAELIMNMDVTLTNGETGEAYGKFHLDLLNPSSNHEVGPYRLEITDYFPELTIRDGVPATNSREAKNPAFIFRIYGPDLVSEGLMYIFVPKLGIMQEVTGEGFQLTGGPKNGRFGFALESADDVQVSSYKTFLNMRTEQGMGYIWFGAAISMIGLIMGFYWQHRRIWLRIDDGRLLLGAHTNKNWLALRKEVSVLLTRTGIDADLKRLQNEVKKLDA